ncbi:hypothetical protein E2I00_013485, partial [Balaenoptera physalus]
MNSQKINIYKHFTKSNGNWKAIQIMIGLMHTDFEIILGLMASIYNQFTITGALSILASKQFSPCLFITNDNCMDLPATVSSYMPLPLIGKEEYSGCTYKKRTRKANTRNGALEQPFRETPSAGRLGSDHMARQTLAIQIMIGIFSVFMWYLLLILYIGQIKGVFGTYEPITYKTGCSLWGIIFIISGVSIIRVARHPSPRLLTYTMIMNILCIIVAVIAVVLTVMELSSFESVSYRNYGQAKFGREISRVLLGFYPLELCIAFTYTIFGYVG